MYILFFGNQKKTDLNYIKMFAYAGLFKGTFALEIH